MARIKKRMLRWAAGIESRFARSRSGSVLVMVVVLLVLMALIGTAFLTTARTDRVGTRVHKNNVQIEMLLDGVVNIAQSAVLNSTYSISAASPLIPPTTSPGGAPYTSQRWDDFFTDPWLAGRYPMPLSDAIGYYKPLIYNPIYTFPQGRWLWDGSKMWVVTNPAGAPSNLAPGAGNYASVAASATDTRIVWPAITAPLIPGAFFEDPRGTASPVRPYQTRINVQPNYLVNPAGGNYPAMTYVNSVNGTLETAIAASASGNGIADSMLWRLPISSIDGVTYFASVRIIDNNSAMNVNTANSCQQSWKFDGTADPAAGYTPGIFPGDIGLGELFLATWGTNASLSVISPELNAINLYRLNSVNNPTTPTSYSAGSIPAAVLPSGITGQTSTYPVDDNNVNHQDFAFRNVSDALYMGLARRIDNPGIVMKPSTPGISGVPYQPFTWNDSTALAYRFDLVNPNATLSNVELMAPRFLYNSSDTQPGLLNPASSNASYNSHPWDPSKVGSATITNTWYYNNYVEQTSYTNRRAFLVARNPTSNLMPAHDLSSLPGGVQFIMGTPTGPTPKVSLNTASTTMLDPIQHTPTLWLGFYNTMADVLNPLLVSAPADGAQSLPTPWMNYTAPWTQQYTPPLPTNTGTVPPPAPQFRSSLRDFRASASNSMSLSTGTYFNVRSQVLLRSLLAAVNAKDIRDTDDDVTDVIVPAIAGAPVPVGTPLAVTGANATEGISAVVAGVAQPVTVHAFGLEKQPFITEVYACNEVKAPDNIAKAGFPPYQANPDKGKLNPKGYVAVELYNPYDTPIDMTNWMLAVLNRNDTTYPRGPNPTIPVSQMILKPITGFQGLNSLQPSGATPGAGLGAIVPAHGFLVLDNYQPGFTNAASYYPHKHYPGISIPTVGVTPATVVFVPNLTDVFKDDGAGMPGGELVLLRKLTTTPVFQKFVDNIHHPLNSFAPVDSFDFAGMYVPQVNANAPTYSAVAIHYVRANSTGVATTVPIGTPNSNAWKFVYPGRWDLFKYKSPLFGFQFHVEGLTTNQTVSEWTTPDVNTAPGTAGSMDMWNATAPTPQINLGRSDPAATYVNNFPGIQLNNTDFGGTNKLTGSKQMFPFGAFARAGDILQVPFIGSYIITDQYDNILEVNSVSQDSAYADDNDSLTAIPPGSVSDDPIEQVGRFCPLKAADPFNNLNSSLAPGIVDTYGWAATIFDYFGVLQAPNDDYLPQVDSTKYAIWNGPPYSGNPPLITPAPQPINNKSPNISTANNNNENIVPNEGLLNINTTPWRILQCVPFVPPTTVTLGSGDAMTLAKEICYYRNTYGPFRTLFDLNKVTAGSSAVLISGAGKDPQVYYGDPRTTDYTPPMGDLSGTLSGTSDGLTNDFETRFGMMTRVSNLLTTRSDTFTVYVLVQGWTSLNTSSPQMVVQRRRAFIIDRSPVTYNPTTGAPLASPEVHNVPVNN